MTGSRVAESFVGSLENGSSSESSLARDLEAMREGPEESQLEFPLFQIDPNEERDAILRQAEASFQDTSGYDLVGSVFLRDSKALAEPSGATSRLESPVLSPAAASCGRSDGEKVTERVLWTALWFQRLVVLTPSAVSGPLLAEDAIVLTPASSFLSPETDFVLPIGGRGVFLLSADHPLSPRDLSLFLLSGRYLGLCLRSTRWKRRLQEIREEARNAKQIRSSVLRNLNHEVRPPLTSVIGFAEVIGQATEDLDVPKANLLQQQASLIQKEGRRLLDVLNHMIRLSKIESQSLDLSSSSVQLAKKTRQISEEYREQAEEKGLEFRVDAAGAPVNTQADPRGIEIILESLLSNAIKYTTEGKVIVRAYSDPDATPPSSVLEIEDTGIGIDPEWTGRIFEPFRQESEGLGRNYEGLGLGLTVTRRVTEQMGGEISVSTQKDRGSTFLVRLPASGQTGST